MSFHCAMVNKHEALLSLAMYMYQTKVICHIKFKQRRLRKRIINVDCFESLGYMLNVSIYHMMGCQLSVNVIYIKYKLIRLMYTPVLWRYTYLKWLKKLIIFLCPIPLQRKNKNSRGNNSINILRVHWMLSISHYEFYICKY